MLLKEIEEAVALIRQRTAFEPQVGIILGSGLGNLAGHIEVECSIDYADIPHFPVSTVAGHAGRLVFGLLAGKRVVAMQGRVHFYEGWTPQQVVFPVRVMARLGIELLVVSNAAGGLNTSFRTGDVMIIKDQINLIPNPLIGRNESELGERFPSMNEAYDRRLIRLAADIAEREGIAIHYGCYVGTTGPAFETPAECRYFAAIGGDAVGMSTTPEVVAARHMKIPVFGVSVITNVAFGDEEPDHKAVMEEGRKAGERLSHLVESLLEELDEQTIKTIKQ